VKKGIEAIFLWIPIAIIAASCSNGKPSGTAMIPFVESILADTTSAEYSLVSSYDDSDKQGCIAIIGTPEECFSLSEQFMTSDIFDNIDGRMKGDGLPDFAGETIISVIDAANSPYEGYVLRKNTDFLKEIAVRESLFAIDSSCRVSPYEKDASVPKLKAKVIILASPLMAEYGFSDVDTLFKSLGKDIPVITVKDTSQTAVVKCFNILRKKNAFTLNIYLPRAMGYVSVPTSDLPASVVDSGLHFNETYKYGRVTNSDKITFTIITFNERYLSGGLISKLGTIAPKTYQSYVQNQYQQ
jgi:hypothetical protein